jgi:methionine biosynthesis protein MetW
MAADQPEAPRSKAAADPASLADIQRRRKEMGDGFPRIALFLFGCDDLETLKQTIDRIPEPLGEWFEEIVVMESGRGTGPRLTADELSRGRDPAVRVHRQPRETGYGGARKAAFEHLLRRGFEHAVVMRGDGSHPPELLPDLLKPVLCDSQPLVFASRLLNRRTALRSGMPLLRLLAHGLAGAIQNRILGTRVRDYLSSFRVYSSDLLRCIPFQLNSDDRHFDAEMGVQCRALGVTVHEVAVAATWREEQTGSEGLRHAARACRTALGYRLHQLHVTQNGRYLVDPGVHYTFKHSRTGSHVQIVDSIERGTRVLDLGCSQGMLASPLREKGVSVTGVDIEPAAHRASELEAYYERDLEQPLEIPEGRSFDYVVLADVIEHLKNRQQLLRSTRRFLKPEGRLIISTPNIALWFYRLSLLAGRFEYGPRGVLDRTHVHLFTRASFRREVERAGFRILDERVTSLPFEVVFQSTGRGITEAYHLLARVWPEMFAYQNILEAEITTLDDEATDR